MSGVVRTLQAAAKHLPEGTGCIINTTSITSYVGEAHLLDYSATKGAITAFTRALSQQMAGKGKCTVHDVCATRYTMDQHRTLQYMAV